MATIATFCLQRIFWYARWSLLWLETRIGWYSLIGGLLLMGAASAVVWSDHLKMELQNRSVGLGDKPLVVDEGAVWREGNRKNLEAFYLQLPQPTEIPAILSRLIELADERDVELKSADYRVVRDDTGGYLKYRISLPVTGNARAIQDFLLAALNAQRTLALESISFKRGQIQSAEIEARIQLALLTRPASQRSRPIQASLSKPYP